MQWTVQCGQCNGVTSVLRSVARLAPLRLMESSRPVAADTDTSMTPATRDCIVSRVAQKKNTNIVDNHSITAQTSTCAPLDSCTSGWVSVVFSSSLVPFSHARVREAADNTAKGVLLSWAPQTGVRV